MDGGRESIYCQSQTEGEKVRYSYHLVLLRIQHIIDEIKKTLWVLYETTDGTPHWVKGIEGVCEQLLNVQKQLVEMESKIKNK